MGPTGMGGLIGAGFGLGKYFLEDLPEQRAQAELQARTAELSPWTGIKPQAVKKANVLGSMLGAGMTGASLGQNYQTMQNRQQLMDMTRKDPRYAPWAMMGGY